MAEFVNNYCFFDSLRFLASFAYTLNQIFQVGHKLGLDSSAIIKFQYFYHLYGSKYYLVTAATLVCWLDALVSKPSCTEPSILISLSISSLFMKYNDFVMKENAFLILLFSISYLWSPRLLNMSKKFWVSVCLVVTFVCAW